MCLAQSARQVAEIQRCSTARTAMLSAHPRTSRARRRVAAQGGWQIRDSGQIVCLLTCYDEATHSEASEGRLLGGV